MPRISVDDGVSLSYRIFGEGPTPLLLVHGWLMSGGVWDEMIEALDLTGLRVIVPDLRGTGESDKPATGYSLERYAKDLLAVADAAGARDFVLVGHSMGGQIAQLLASLEPERVKGLMLVNSVPASGLPLPPDAYGLFSSAGGDREKSRIVLGLSTRNAPNELIERLLDVSANTRPECAREALDAWTGTSFVERLSAITAPTLVLATDDAFLPVPFLKEAIVSKIARARLAYLPGPGHYPQVERSRETAAILSAFIGGLN